MALPSLMEHLAVREVKSDEFISMHRPQGMGNSAPIAYGGNTLAIATNAACKTVGSGFHLYSMLGSFHGPARTDRHLRCRVFRTRDTKTFATRRVVLYQLQDNGSERTCADVFVDFHIDERAMFEYDAPPSPLYRGHNAHDPLKTVDNKVLIERLVRSGKASRATADAHLKMFSMADSLFDFRQCVDGVGGQTMNGLAKDLTTTQDHLPIYEKSSAEWMKTRHALSEHSEHMTALTFIMDGSLSFLPLNLDHKDFTDAGACSTLDFALRVFVPDVAMDTWHMRERKTLSAHGARTYSESRLWEENGRMVAVMTQTSICRPPQKPKTSQPKL